jgi:hypothetical protein
MNRWCEACGEGFWQGRGRPAKRCPPCREGDRYGPRHRATRAETVPLAYGKPCARCGKPMLPGQNVQLDHDDQDPGRYIGYSHQRCNASAGASRGNAMRAAAYRAAKGLPSPNGTVRRAPPPAPDDPPDGTVRELEGGRVERWSATYRQWVRASRRW